MRAAKHHPNTIGVQIVQIGNDAGAVDVLKDLMYGDVGVRIILVLIRRELMIVCRAWSIQYPITGY